MIRPLVDQRSFDLAEYFLPDGAAEQRKWDLAEVIQRAVEDWLIYEDGAEREMVP